MAKIIDLRGTGGQMVLIGEAFALPTSTTAMAGTTTVVAGSLRYNPTINTIQYVATSATDWMDLAPAYEAVTTLTAASNTLTRSFGTYLRCLRSSAMTIVVPNSAVEAFPIGTKIRLQRAGTGAVTVSAANGVTINASSLTISAQYGAATLIKVAANEWDLIDSSSGGGGGGGGSSDAATLNGQAGSYYLSFANATNKPTTIAGYGITDAVTTFAQLGSKPTTLAGYGITDAQSATGSVAWSRITTAPTTLAGYGITDAQTATGNVAWSRITGTPTTRSGYGLTDVQPLDAGLTSLANLSTLGLYYLSANDVWSPVTIGANITFSGGTLSATGGGGGGGGGDMFKADNLSGLTNYATARTNLGASTVGNALFIATDASAARSAIGAGTGNGTVTAVTGTAPIVSSGGATPALSISPATTVAAGSLSAADKLKLDATSGTNTGDQTSVTGNAGTATKLATARTINGTAFDGTANITIAANWSAVRTLSGTGDATFSLSVDGSSNVSGAVSLAASGATAGTYTKATITVDAKGRVTSATSGVDQTTITGNAGSATKLATARAINGVSFDGTADITVADTTKAPLLQPIVTYTGSTTLASGDVFAFVRMSSSSANTYTVATNATVALPIGSRIDLQQSGTGQTSIAPASGVTIQSDSGYLKLKGQYTSATLLKVDTNTWTLIGALVA